MNNDSFNVTEWDSFSYADYGYIYYIDTDVDPPKTLSMKITTVIVWIEVIFGLLLNLFNIIVLRRTTALIDFRIQLINFAIADVLLGFSALFTLHIIHVPRSVHSVHLCRLKVLFANMAFIAPLICRVFVGVEILLHSLVTSLSQGYRKRYKLIVVAVIWVANLLLNVYRLTQVQVFSWFRSKRSYCHDTNNSYFWTLVLAEIPLTVVLLAVYCIVGVLKLCKKSAYSQMERSSLSFHSQLKRMLLIDAVVLLFLYSPMNIFVLYLTSPAHHYYDQQFTFEQLEMLLHGLSLLMITKCLISPIIYCASNPSYRAEVKKMCSNCSGIASHWAPTVMYRRNGQEVMLNGPST